MNRNIVAATTTRRYRWLAALLLPAALLSPARAEEMPKAQTGAANEPPAYWREYLQRARVAEAIADPLQRCLAFPDLPGNAWPQGHAAAHCRAHTVPFIGFDEIAELVRRGDTVTLESKMSDLLRRHFVDGPDFSENIHDVFDGFTVSQAGADEVSRKWLQLAPDSTYANLARGAYLKNMAWQARGTKYAADTPQEAMDRMVALFAQAIPLLKKAIEIDPKAMPAYAMLVEISKSGSMDKAQRYVVSAGFAQDPACINLLRHQLFALLPRWGGSYTEMEAALERARPFLAARPTIAVRFADPHLDMGSRLFDQSLYGQAEAALDEGIRAGSDEATLQQAAKVAIDRKDGHRDLWKAQAYLLQVARFSNISPRWQRQLGQLLVWSGEAARAIPYLQASLKAEPDSAYAHYWLAIASHTEQQMDLADANYLVAMRDPAFALDSALEGAHLWVFQRRADKAKPYIDMLASDFPDNGYGRYLKLLYDPLLTGRVNEEALRRFVKETPPGDDRRLAAAIGHLNEMLAKMDDMRAKLERGEPVPELEAMKR